MKTFLRFFLVSFKYPASFFAFVLRLIARLPFFNLQIDFPSPLLALKSKLRSQRTSSIGHALGSRSISVSFLNKKLLSVYLREGSVASADQFYLSRPVNDISTLLQINNQLLDLIPNSSILDPGCGCAKHLFYFADKFNCDCTGIDIYEHAIAVAKTANFDSRLRLYSHSSLDCEFLDSIISDRTFDFLFLNSWLNHVYLFPGYAEAINLLASSCRYILVINSSKYGIKEFFDNPQIISSFVLDSTQYLLIRGLAQ